jgi:AcrR family transcriptional regulator
MEKEEIIIEGALELFMKNGVKTVNMDDVSSHMGISKKTLYQYVSNKTDLVEKCFSLHQSSILEMINRIQEKNKNAIEELFDIDEQVCVMLKNRPPMLIHNVQKYYPSVWKILDEIKKKHIFSCVTQNIEHGKTQGFYRADVNADIIAKLMMNTVDALVNEELFPLTQYDFKALLKENRVYHIRGIATQQGINYLEQKLKND